MTMVFTAEEITLFKQRGFLVKPAFFTAAAIRRISDWLDRLSQGSGPAGTEARYYETSPVNGRDILVRVEHFLGADHPEVTALLLSPGVMTAAAGLLGEPAVLFKEKVNYKLPGCRADKLHQDQAAGWNAYCDFFLTMALNMIHQQMRYEWMKN